MHLMSPTTAYPVPPAAVLDVCLCHGTRRTARVLSRLYDAALAPFGLKVGQFGLLTAIGAFEPVSVPRLGEIMRMDPSTLSRNLKPLRAAGYVISAGGAGRRAAQVELTAHGRDTLAAALPSWQKVQGEVTRAIGSGTAGMLLQALETTAKNLE